MKINAFTKSYGKKRVLNFPGIELENGIIYAVIGANGSGKSTFAKIIAGIEKADGNLTAIDGCHIGYMPQKSFAFNKTVKGNVLLNGKNETRAEMLIDVFGLKDLSNSNAKKLSGGETARMALARLMMKYYDIVILDEPTASMDMESTLISENQIKNYCKETKCALILITHSLQQAKRIADNVIYFEKGELVEIGCATDVLNSPKKVETKTFLDFYGL